MQELPKERLATTDAKGNRVYLYPASVRGLYFNRKQWVHGGLVLFFLLLPWVRPNGQQLLLLDVAKREFFFFGLHFRAHDAPLLLFLVLAFLFAVGFVTSVWGRLWCGWACPQTVFTEFLFRRLERWIEGGPRERKELDESPWTSEKLFRKILKWSAFLLVSLLFTHSFLAYFVGSKEIFSMVFRPPGENWGSFLVILFTTAMLLFDFGWFREQFCVIACPYGRLQSVMLGRHSLVIGYDSRRGEPRKILPHSGGPHGDCVSCLRCVQVCPTGIDIRRGLQMECVACTACIDACDEVMAKTKKPAGLIRYMNLGESLGKAYSGWNIRAVAFAALFLMVTSGLAAVLGKKDFLEVLVLRAKGAPYTTLSNIEGEIVINHFHLEISNQTGRTEEVKIDIVGNSEGLSLVMPQNPILVQDGEKKRVDFFLKFPRALLANGSGNQKVRLFHAKKAQDLEVSLVGPQ